MEDEIVADLHILDQRGRDDLRNTVERDLRHAVGQHFLDLDRYG
jgi:hypothetical protein